MSLPNEIIPVGLLGTGTVDTGYQDLLVYYLLGPLINITNCIAVVLGV